MKKKITGILLSASVLFAVGAPFITASAADDITVNVTITKAGETKVSAQPVHVADKDGDGKYTIDEALFAAHEAYYEGGAAAGYESAMSSDYGLSLKKLWGDTSGAFGYYADDKYVMGLSDEVTDGGCLTAFVFKDTATYGDKYCYFDKKEITGAKQGDTVKLKLSVIHFDANFAPQVDPAANATITVDGEKTAYKTDANGEVDFKFERSGNLILGAVSDTEILVPTVLRASVAAAETTAVEATTTAAPATTTQAAAAVTTTSAKAAATVTTTAKGSGSSSTSAAKTGDTTAIPALALTAALACGAAYALRRRND